MTQPAIPCPRAAKLVPIPETPILVVENTECDLFRHIDDGAGRGAAYNPATGTYARGGYAYGYGGATKWGQA